MTTQRTDYIDIEALDQYIEARKAELAQLSELRKTLRQFTTGAKRTVSTAKASPRKQGGHVTLSDMLYDIVSKANEPARVTDLVRTVKRRGKSTTYGSIYVTLIKDGRYERTAPATFTLADDANAA